MNTLIVEDDQTSAELLHRILEPYGRVTVTAGGEEAIAAFKTAVDDDDRFDLVCLDIMMPGMDGHQVLQRLRAHEHAHGISGLQGCKVIMVTALGDTASVIKAFKAQCEAYLVKPIERDHIIDQIQRLGLIPSSA